MKCGKKARAAPYQVSPKCIFLNIKSKCIDDNTIYEVGLTLRQSTDMLVINPHPFEFLDLSEVYLDSGSGQISR